MDDKTQKHPFKPVYDEHSRVLILGSFPPLRTSQKGGFYYADSSNRFWKILSTLFCEPKLADKSKDEKIAFLKAQKIALYDIWELCYKENLDSTDDKDIVASKSQKADLSELLQAAKIQKIFTTIGGSEKSKDKRGGHFKKWGVESWLWDNYSKFMPHCKSPSQMVVPLYSTSNASSRAGINDEILLDDYKQIKEILHKG